MSLRCMNRLDVRSDQEAALEEGEEAPPKYGPGGLRSSWARRLACSVCCYSTSLVEGSRPNLSYPPNDGPFLHERGRAE